MSFSRTIARRPLPLLLLAAVAAGALSFAGAHAASPAAAPNDAIEQAMGQMNQALKALGKGITAENKATALEELVKFEQAVLAAKSQTPDSAAGVDEKKRAEFVAEFRSTLCEALKLACDAEIAVANGKYKDAEGIVKGKLPSVKSAGHDKFKKDDEGGPGGGR
jgi:cytochrome b562